LHIFKDKKRQAARAYFYYLLADRSVFTSYKKAVTPFYNLRWWTLERTFFIVFWRINEL